jgi:hypothetical protein
MRTTSGLRAEAWWTMGAAFALVSSAGCAAAPPAAAPAAAQAYVQAAPEPSPSAASTTPATAEDAQADLDRSAATIDRLLGGALLGGAPAGTPGKEEDRKPVDARKPEAQAGGTGPCSEACAALASMGRAAGSLCALAGEGDGRCKAARERVHGAEARVRSACPGCAQ